MCFVSRNIIVRLWFEPLMINACITMSRWTINDMLYILKSSMFQSLVKKCEKGILKFLFFYKQKLGSEIVHIRYWKMYFVLKYELKRRNVKCPIHKIIREWNLCFTSIDKFELERNLQKDAVHLFKKLNVINKIPRLAFGKLISSNKCLIK